MRVPYGAYDVVPQQVHTPRTHGDSLRPARCAFFRVGGIEKKYRRQWGPSLQRGNDSLCSVLDSDNGRRFGFLPPIRSQRLIGPLRK